MTPRNLAPAPKRVVAAGYTQRHVLDVLTPVALKTVSNYVNIVHTPLDGQFAAQTWTSQAATVA